MTGRRLLSFYRQMSFSGSSTSVEITKDVSTIVCVLWVKRVDGVENGSGDVCDQEVALCRRVTL